MSFNGITVRSSKKCSTTASRVISRSWNLNATLLAAVVQAFEGRAELNCFFFGHDMAVLRSRVGLRTAGNNQHRALRVTHDVFCDAPDERVLQSGPTVSRSDDEINLGLARCGADFVYRGTGKKFGLNRQPRKKSICLSASISCRAVSSTASASPERRTPARSTNT